MKKSVAMLLLLALALSLCACGATESAPTAPAETKPAPTVQVVEGEPIEQLDDVSVYIPVTGEAIKLEELPAYVCSEGSSANYKGSKKGRYGEKTYMLEKTDAASFLTYLNALESDGWVQYSNSILDGTNLFATYTKGEGSLYCYYISAKNRAYICASPNQNLEVRQQDNQYEAVCEPQLTQIKMLAKEYQGGMGYVLRLSDGRFIIIDGGYNENDFYHAQYLYAMLQEQNVLDKITVAAWIITHPHGDHLGTAADFLRFYKPTQLDIQQMIFNFPTDEDITTIEPEAMVNHPSYMPTFMLALESLWGHVPVTVCHTGQRYYFADATIEFLHTLEDFYPQTVVNLGTNNVNGASAIFTLEVGGQKTMFLGDSSVDCSKDLVKMWGNYLQSDIMQAAHHCQRGATVELYEAIDPTVVLAPLSAKSIKARSILEYEATRWLWNNQSGNIKEIILSGWEQRTLVLPYTPAAGTEFFSNATSDPWADAADQYQKK